VRADSEMFPMIDMIFFGFGIIEFSNDEEALK
jgi:hypothetical protein